MNIIVKTRHPEGQFDIGISSDEFSDIFLTTPEAIKLRDDITIALSDNVAASRPKLAVTPGRYRMAYGGEAFVTTVMGETAVGYYTSGKEAYSLGWTSEGRHAKYGPPDELDLVERLGLEGGQS